MTITVQSPESEVTSGQVWHPYLQARNCSNSEGRNLDFTLGTELRKQGPLFFMQPVCVGHHFHWLLLNDRVCEMFESFFQSHGQE